MKKNSCKCSVIAGNTVPNPECPVHVEVVDVRVAPSRSAAPPFKDWAEKWAKDFHDTYERSAPAFGYETRKESAKPWADVPENNRKLMIAVCAEVLCRFEKERTALYARASAAPPSEREAFEKWANGKGISLKKRADGEYVYDSTSNIFLGFCAGQARAAVPQAAADATGRTDADYAIEFGEYLAKAVEFHIAELNRFWEAEEAGKEPDTDTLNDAFRAVHSALGEFRKRARRARAAAVPAPAETTSQRVAGIRAAVQKLACGEAPDHDELSDEEYKALAKECGDLSDYLGSISESFALASNPDWTALLAKCCEQLAGATAPPKEIENA